MSNENLQVVRSIYDAFARNDGPAAFAALDPDIEWREADNFLYADGNPYRGHDAVLNGVFARLGAEWDGFGAVPEEFLDAGDRVVVLGRYRGTYKATGKSVHAQFVHVHTLRAGKVIAFQQYCDTAQFRAAVR